MKATRYFLFGLAMAGLSYASFDACKFNFGKGWTKSTNLSGMDFATIYAGDGGFNDNHHGVFLAETKAANVTPMLYGYITAFMAREQGGLKDCDMGTPNLCQNGSNYIRSNKAAILNMYGTYSQKIAAVWGANAQVIWLIEPDLYQYSVSGSNQRKAYNGQEQAGGGIPDADIATFFKDIATKIRQYMPNAKVGVDLSPWIASPNSYYSHFDKSILDFAFTSGGRTEAANTKIRSADKMTWAGAKALLGKPILADCGYGVGGSKDGHHSEWDNLGNLNSRIAEGVISINQFDARSDWASAVLNSLRPQITNFCSISSAAPGSSMLPVSSSVPPSSSVPRSSSNPVGISSSNVATPSSSSQGSIPDGSNYVRNGAFDNGTSEWTVTAKASANGSATIQNGIYYMGGWGGSDLMDLVISQGNINLPAGSHPFRFETRTNSNNTRPLVFRVVAGNQELCRQSIELDGTMKKHECTLNLAAAATVSVEFLAGGGYWQDVRLDNVTIPNQNAPIAKAKSGPLSGMRAIRNGALLEIRNAPLGAQMQLLNIHGQLVAQSVASTPTVQFPVQDLKPGLYFVRAEGLGARGTVRVPLH